MPNNRSLASLMQMGGSHGSGFVLGAPDFTSAPKALADVMSKIMQLELRRRQMEAAAARAAAKAAASERTTVDGTEGGALDGGIGENPVYKGKVPSGTKWRHDIEGRNVGWVGSEKNADEMLKQHNAKLIETKTKNLLSKNPSISGAIDKAKDPTLSIAARADALKGVRTALSGMDTADANFLLERVVAPMQAEHKKERAKIDSDAGLGVVSTYLKQAWDDFTTSKELMLPHTAEEKLDLARSHNERQAERMNGNAYLADQAKMAAEGKDFFERTNAESGHIMSNILDKGMGVATDVARNIAIPAAVGAAAGSFIPVIGTAGGALIGGALGTNEAYQQGRLDYLSRLAADDSLTQDQKLAVLNSNAGAGGEYGTGAVNAIAWRGPAALKAGRGMAVKRSISKLPAGEQAAARAAEAQKVIDATTKWNSRNALTRLALSEVRTNAELGAIVGGSHVAGNAIYNASTGKDVNLDTTTEGLGDALGESLALGLVMGVPGMRQRAGIGIKADRSSKTDKTEAAKPDDTAPVNGGGTVTANSADYMTAKERAAARQAARRAQKSAERKVSSLDEEAISDDLETAREEFTSDTYRQASEELFNGIDAAAKDLFKTADKKAYNPTPSDEGVASYKDALKQAVSRFLSTPGVDWETRKLRAFVESLTQTLTMKPKQNARVNTWAASPNAASSILKKHPEYLEYLNDLADDIADPNGPHKTDFWESKNTNGAAPSAMAGAPKEEAATVVTPAKPEETPIENTGAAPVEEIKEPQNAEVEVPSNEGAPAGSAEPRENTPVEQPVVEPEGTANTGDSGSNSGMEASGETPAGPAPAEPLEPIAGGDQANTGERPSGTPVQSERPTENPQEAAEQKGSPAEGERADAGSGTEPAAGTDAAAGESTGGDASETGGKVGRAFNVPADVSDNVKQFFNDYGGRLDTILKEYPEFKGFFERVLNGPKENLAELDEFAAGRVPGSQFPEEMAFYKSMRELIKARGRDEALKVQEANSAVVAPGVTVAEAKVNPNNSIIPSKSANSTTEETNNSTTEETKTRRKRMPSSNDTPANTSELYSAAYPKDSNNDLFERARSVVRTEFIDGPLKAISEPKGNDITKKAYQILQSRGAIDKHGNIVKSVAPDVVREVQSDFLKGLAQHVAGIGGDEKKRYDVMEYLSFNKVASQYRMNERDAELDRLRALATATAMGKKMLTNGADAANLMERIFDKDLSMMFSSSINARGEEISDILRGSSNMSRDQATKLTDQFMKDLRKNATPFEKRGGKRVVDALDDAQREVGKYGNAADPAVLTEADVVTGFALENAEHVIATIDAMFPDGSKKSLRDRFAGESGSKHATDDYRKLMNTAVDNIDTFARLAETMLITENKNPVELSFKQFSQALSKAAKGEGNTGRLMRDSKFQQILYNEINEYTEGKPDLVEDFKKEYNCY